MVISIPTLPIEVQISKRKSVWGFAIATLILIFFILDVLHRSIDDRYTVFVIAGIFWLFFFWNLVKPLTIVFITKEGVRPLNQKQYIGWSEITKAVVFRPDDGKDWLRRIFGKKNYKRENIAMFLKSDPMPISVDGQMENRDIEKNASMQLHTFFCDEDSQDISNWINHYKRQFSE